MLSRIIKQNNLHKVQIIQCFLRSSASNIKKPVEDIKFDAISTTYGYKSTGELFRGWLVFKLCSYTSLVNHLSQLFTISRTILGQRLFDYLIRSTLYEHFVAGVDKSEVQPIVNRLHKHGVKLILDYSMESDIVVNKQRNTKALINEEVYNENMLASIKNVQAAAELCGASAITALKITAFVPPEILQKLNEIIEKHDRLHKQSIVEISSNTSLMNKTEATEVENLIRRIHTIVQEVKKHSGKILIDAEQSYFQTAIHKLVLELQNQYNRDRITVYNTYQCYRKTTVDLLQKDLLQSKNNQFNIGIKLVRGAYMDQERKRATELNCEDPIHPNFEATTESYYRAFVSALEHAKKNYTNNKVHAFVASHNEKTVEFALKTMKSMNIQRDDGIVSFATLFGMCDYLTFPLATAGYDGYKLTPYGPINCLLPYLTRRAQENRAIFAKAEKDRQLYYQALKQRFFKFSFSSVS